VSNSISVIYFDIGDTLARTSLGNAPGEPPLRLFAIDGVKDHLQEIKGEGFRLGIISNTPDGFTQEVVNDALRSALLLDFFESDLLLYSSVTGKEKTSPETFKFAADQATPDGGQRPECLFVGENDAERFFAREADFKTAASVSAALDVVSGTLPSH